MPDQPADPMLVEYFEKQVNNRLKTLDDAKSSYKKIHRKLAIVLIIWRRLTQPL